MTTGFRIRTAILPLEGGAGDPRWEVVLQPGYTFEGQHYSHLFTKADALCFSRSAQRSALPCGCGCITAYDETEPDPTKGQLT